MAVHRADWTSISFRPQCADLEIICAKCRRRVVWTAFTVERFFAGAPVPAEEMARRFRCRKCHGRGAGIAALIRMRR